MTNSMDLAEVSKRKLWLVTGKGGVGKTTMAAALGLMAARKGMKTLLVETYGMNHLGELLGVGSAGYEGKKVQKNLDLLQVTPELAFEEYVLQQIKFRMIYNAVFNNKYVRHFIDAAPGLAELLTIGKIWALVDRYGNGNNNKKYDLVIVDAPSTGHGLSMLMVPEVVVRAVRVGPLKTKSENILQLLRDPARSLVWLVTLPEEMPVNETAEMAEKLESQVKMQLGPTLVNALWPKVLSPEIEKELEKSGAHLPILEVHQRRQAQSDFYLDKIKTKLSGRSFLELPLIYQNASPLELAKMLSKDIERQLGGQGA